MRKYASLWAELKDCETVSFTVSTAGFRRIWNGIKLEKTIENTARRDVGLSTWPKLVVHKQLLDAKHIKVTLTFYELLITKDFKKL